MKINEKLIPHFETINGWNVLKFGNTGGTAICYKRVQYNNVAITTSASGEYKSSFVPITDLPTGITPVDLSATPTNGSQSDGTYILRTSINTTSNKAECVFTSPVSSASKNLPIFFTLIGTWGN